MSLKRPLVTISFPDKPDCSTQLDANVDQCRHLLLLLSQVLVTSFQKCLYDCTSKIKKPLVIPKIVDITFPAICVPCENL